MTSHELARILLSGPDLPVMSYNGDFGVAIDVESVLSVVLLERNKVARVWEWEEPKPEGPRAVLLYHSSDSCPCCGGVWREGDLPEHLPNCSAKPIGGPDAR